jgi:ketosteroid isomerase-like protein
MLGAANIAQGDQRDIDEQVWRPFTAAIHTHDVAAFMALHSADVVRVERNARHVMDFAEYRRQMETSWARFSGAAPKAEKFPFELRFTERLCNGSLANEVGYYRFERTLPNGESRASYGRFQVVLRKEGGVWKILVDSDTHEGGVVTDEMFNAAQPVTSPARADKPRE